ncbi:hypothetical protein [Oceanidesulfovibrio marinus]|uniref:Uncharacterized protein n=1 Tax=Oceanidesulfovibrio marinus TaxID=370038 RepID=A0A6P1ZMQ1_9BACT|nr:hypothetical protein [Oceanidesulfovibrio marinus]TVM35647.1 hypothetical protein DQK91_02985 [Oceanidesulfovibrio marinus]
MGHDDNVIVKGVVLIAETPLAYGFGYDTDDEPKWIAKCLVEDIRPEHPERGDEVEMVIPEWKAEKEELEYI